MVSGYFSVYLQESNVSRLSRFSFSVPVVSPSATVELPFSRSLCHTENIIKFLARALRSRTFRARLVGKSTM